MQRPTIALVDREISGGAGTSSRPRAPLLAIETKPTLPPGDATVTRAEPTIDRKLIELRNAEADINAGRMPRRR